MKKAAWNAHKQEAIGYVNLGGGCTRDVLATESLVIMAVGIKSIWKQPLAYFLTDKLTGATQHRLLTIVMDSLIGIDVIPVSITLDGTQANFLTMKMFGCNTNPDSLNSGFSYPGSPLKTIFYIPDACHMLKLLRNLFGKMKEIRVCGEVVRWSHIERLFEIQSREGLKAANKLSIKHINWQKQKMKVNPYLSLLNFKVK